MEDNLLSSMFELACSPEGIPQEDPTSQCKQACCGLKKNGTENLFWCTGSTGYIENVPAWRELKIFSSIISN
jgi:hypothetical protein